MNDSGSRLRQRRILTALLAVVLVGIGGILLTARYDAYSVKTATMLPTVAPKDVGFFTDVSGPADVRRGEIVRFDPDWDGTAGVGAFTFRVGALGGDTISGDNAGHLSLNDKPLEEPYLGDQVDQPASAFKVTVPKGRLFVLGDARSISNDSRSHLSEQQGTIALDAVSGRLVGLGWPLWHWNMLDSNYGFPWLYLASSALLLVGAVLGLAVAWRIATHAFGIVLASGRRAS